MRACADIGFDATTTLKRSEFGLGKFVPQVSDAIPMHIIAQAVDAKKAPNSRKRKPRRKRLRGQQSDSECTAESRFRGADVTGT